MKFKDYIDPPAPVREGTDTSDVGKITKALHLVVLGLGDEEGTFADVASRCSQTLPWNLLQIFVLVSIK